MPQCSKNIICMKDSHVPCENDSLKHFFFFTCYEIFWLSIKSIVASDFVVVDMFIKSFCADCLTHMSTFSEDVRMFSGFWQNTRVSRYVCNTLVYDFNTVYVTKWIPNRVIRNLGVIRCDILKSTKVIVHILINRCRHVNLVTFFFLSAGGFLTTMCFFIGSVKMTITHDSHLFVMAQEITPQLSGVFARVASPSKFFVCETIVDTWK